MWEHSRSKQVADDRRASGPTTDNKKSKRLEPTRARGPNSASGATDKARGHKRDNKK